MALRPRRGRPAAGLLPIVALVLAATGLVGCGVPGHDDTLLGPDPAAVRDGQQALLDARAHAVRTGNLQQFLATVDRSDKALVKRQRQLFANLRALPLAGYSYRVGSSVWPAELLAKKWGSEASVPHVQVRMRLQGYDASPTTAETGFVFAPRKGHLLIVSDRTGSGAPFPGVTPAPWELTRIHVHRSTHVLALFDDQTDAHADEVMAALDDGVEQVSRGLPFTWGRRVVVYTFANRQVLDSFAGVPGGNIRHLGAMTFPVYGSGVPPVGLRIALLPGSVAAGQPFLGRITRHEMTHVALGDRDDGVPTWLTEGIAEYVGARDLPASERRIASIAVSRAAGLVTSMPSSRGFNGADQDWHYALSWMACDEIARTKGESTLWALLDRLHNGGAGTPDSRQDAVVREVLGYDTSTLAHKAAARIVQTYG